MNDTAPAVAKTGKPHARLTVEADRATLKIPPRHGLMYVGYSLIVWLFVGIIVVSAWPTGLPSGGGVISRLARAALSWLPAGWPMPVLITLFVLMTVVLVMVVAFMLLRVEVARFGASTLRLETWMAGRLIEEKEFDRASVVRLRGASDEDRKASSLFGETAWDDEGMLAFDYGTATVTFGACLPPAEAREIAARLRRELPEWFVGERGIG